MLNYQRVPVQTLYFYALPVRISRILVPILFLWLCFLLDGWFDGLIRDSKMNGHADVVATANKTMSLMKFISSKHNFKSLGESIAKSSIQFTFALAGLSGCRSENKISQCLMADHQFPCWSCHFWGLDVDGCWGCYMFEVAKKVLLRPHSCGCYFPESSDNPSVFEFAMLISIWLVVWNMNFIFPYIGNNNPNWLIFFRGVETTNQQFVDMFFDISLFFGKHSLTMMAENKPM